MIARPVLSPKKEEKKRGKSKVITPRREETPSPAANAAAREERKCVSRVFDQIS